MPGEEQTISQFALVAYLPDPLGRFLDDLRVELTPDCKPHAHVTILPPRPLCHDLADTVHQLTDDLQDGLPFRVDLGQIETFAATQVIYLGLADGASELRRLYGALNCGCLEYKENFPYHPHITIAQNIPTGNAPKLARIATERFANYRGPRGFDVTVLSLVQHVAPSIWIDVATLRLTVAVPKANVPIAG